MSTTLSITQTNINNTTTSPDSSTSSSSQQKKYSLVKWLENRQFDVQNEWVGRLTSVQHSNIIDFDADELKAGMEISVFRNGEIWRAQVIIPKTASNTIDLPPSSNKSASKIRTKAMATTTTSKINENGELISPENSLNSELNNESNNQKTFVDLNDFNIDDEKIHQQQLTTNNSTSTANINNKNNELSTNTNSINNVNTNQNSTANLVILTTDATTNGSSISTAIPNGHHIVITENKLTKDLQLLQTAISEAGSLNEVYQINPSSPLILRNNVTTSSTTATTATNSNNLNGNSYITLTNANNNSNNNTTNVVTVNDMNIETILQMQCELLEQQKELKYIEIETMEQLKLLHQNINRLAKKFDSFENIISNINKLTPTNSTSVLTTTSTSASSDTNKSNSPSSQPLKIRRIS